MLSPFSMIRPATQNLKKKKKEAINSHSETFSFRILDRS